jgi:hypothetical protein
MADMSEIFKMFSDKMNSDPDSIKNIISAFQNSGNKIPPENETAESTKTTSGPDIETMMKIKKIMDSMNSGANDPRSNLLLSLKPYLRDAKKTKVEQYIKLLNITKVMSIFNDNEGDKK